VDFLGNNPGFSGLVRPCGSDPCITSVDDPCRGMESELYLYMQLSPAELLQSFVTFMTLVADCIGRKSTGISGGYSMNRSQLSGSKTCFRC